MISVGSKTRPAPSILAVAGLASTLGASACSSKDRPPMLVDDMITRPDVGVVTTPEDGGTDEVGAADGGDGMQSVTGTGPLFKKCVSDVKMQTGVVADPWFCISTTDGHPAASSVYRNLLYPAIAFAFHLDDADHKLETRMFYGIDEWDFDVTMPTDQKLAGGLYSTGENNGSAIHFKWYTGDCGTEPESGIFQIFNIAWYAGTMLT